MLRLQFSGYSEKIRKEVLKSTIKAPENIKWEVAWGKRPFINTGDGNNKREQKLRERRRQISTIWAAY